MGFYKGKPWQRQRTVPSFRFKVQERKAKEKLPGLSGCLKCGEIEGRGSQRIRFAFFFPFPHLPIFSLCSQARGIEIGGAGHPLFLDNSEEFLAVVRNFVLEIKE